MKVGLSTSKKRSVSRTNELVFVVAEVVDLGDARRGSEADLYAVEMLEHPAPLAVDAAMALIGDHEIEVACGIFAVDIDHALQGGDGDALFVLKATAGPQDIGWEVWQVFGEGVLGLLGEGYPVDKE